MVNLIIVEALGGPGINVRWIPKNCSLSVMVSVYEFFINIFASGLESKSLR